jgi:hypothetical protein
MGIADLNRFVCWVPLWLSPADLRGYYCSNRRMEVPASSTVLSALAELRKELQGELAGLVETRSELEGELQAVSVEIESKQRALELVEATQRQLAGQGCGRSGIAGNELVRA